MAVQPTKTQGTALEGTMNQIWGPHRMGPHDIFQLFGLRKPTVKRGTPALRIPCMLPTSGTGKRGCRIQFDSSMPLNLTKIYGNFWSLSTKGILYLLEQVSSTCHGLQPFYGYKDIGYIGSKSNFCLLQQSRTFPQKTLDWALGWVRPSLFPVTIHFCYEYVCQSVSGV